MKDKIYPPDEEQIREIQTSKQDDLSITQKWYANYLIARKLQEKGQTKKSCFYYKRLTNELRFPLRDLALIRSIEVCRYSEEDLINLWKKSSRIENSHLAKYYYETSLSFSKKLQNKYYYAYFLYKSSKYLKDSKQRELYLRSAIKVATEDNDKEEFEEELIKIAPRFSKEVNFDNAYEIARDYEKNRNFSKARKNYFYIINNPEYDLKDRYKAFERVCLTYKNSRDKLAYLQKRKQMVSFLQNVSENYDEKNRLYVESFIKYIRALWTENQTDRSIILTKKILNKFVGTNEQKSTLLWLLGGMYKEKEKLVTSQNYFLKALEITNKDHEYYDNIIWDVGWSYYSQQNYIESAKIFKKHYEERGEFDSNKQRYKFWFAKSLQKIGENLIAKLRFKEIIEEDPFGYYALLSSIETSSAINTLENKQREIGRYTPVFEWLISTKEYKIAADYLDYKLEQDDSPGGIFKRLPLYLKAQYYDGGIITFYRLSKEEREKTEKSYTDIIYPTAYRNEIIKYSKKYATPAELIFSIIRQESAFNKYARSPSDAFGLMQLIPKLASKLSDNTDKKYITYNDLYDEIINIELGTKHISALLKKNNDSLIKTIASYNAGASPVKRWYETRYQGDSFEFIESIPYRETRNYVKLVLRNIMIYKRLISKDPFYFTKDQIQ